MPGQNKRKQKQRQIRGDHAALDTLSRWETVYETDDFVSAKSYLRDLHAVHDARDVRVDTFCGRLVVPTTYRVSLRTKHPD